VGGLARLDDDDGHGTMVAGAAAATGRVLGVSPTSPVLPVKVAATLDVVTPETIVKGLELAAAKKAIVAVLPSSQPLTQAPVNGISAVGRAVEAALGDGLITVVPVGNDGKGAQVFPGGLAHVLTVGSASSFGSREAFSNFGPWLDLVTAGRDLVLPVPPAQCASGYARGTGTSFSAGAVAGAVALIGAARPALRAENLYDLVRRFAILDAQTAGFDADSGFGLVDVGAGLDAKTPAADLPESNDQVFWLRRSAARFPVLLRSARSATVRGTVSPGKDPQDAMKVALRRGDVLSVATRGTAASALLAATVWSPRTGSFDMSLPAPGTLLRDTSGFTREPELSFRATSTGTHYVAVFAPDWVPPGEDEEGGTFVTSGPPHVAFALSLRKRCSSSRTLAVPLGRLRRPGGRLTSVTILEDGIRRVRWTRAQVRRRVRLDGFANGRHEVVFRAAFSNRAQTRVARVIRTRCTLRLAR
ncbi:MAG: S8 family serine peptidase, partial [Solirubrobacteraceae bacterium]|nr:S8 family serine peptidase [Solirubrobacteraceae bacterium]